MKPNLVIFRIPDFEGKKVFAQIPVDDQKLFVDQVGEFYARDADDTYNSLEFYHVVLAMATEDGQGSFDLGRYAYEPEGIPTQVYDHQNLVEIIGSVYFDFINRPESTLQ